MYLDGLNNAGLVDIKCPKCGEKICQMVYKGFSTAICYKCAKVNPAEEAKPLEIRGDYVEDLTPAEIVMDVVDAVVEKADQVVQAIKKRRTSSRLKLKKPVKGK